MSCVTVVDETLQLRLRAMHLPSFLDHHVELAERAAAEGWRHVRYLSELVTLEANDWASPEIPYLNEGRLSARIQHCLELIWSPIPNARV